MIYVYISVFIYNELGLFCMYLSLALEGKFWNIPDNSMVYETESGH